MAKEISFIKMQGAGNDFVFLTPAMVGRPLSAALARQLLDRHFGVGGDQLLYLQPGKKRGAYALRFFNADGSEAEMCGNGTRAVANYLYQEKNVRTDFIFETKAGDKKVHFESGAIFVDMGEPVLEGRRIPVKADGVVENKPLRVGGRTFKIHAVSMGNPHAVVFVNDVHHFPVHLIGPLLETHPFFPKRVNVEFVRVVSKGRVEARVWERGAGETLACGSGACAIAVASARAGLTGRRLFVDLPGGRLGVIWDSDNRVHLSGPAETVFKGKIFL